MIQLELRSLALVLVLVPVMSYFIHDTIRPGPYPWAVAPMAFTVDDGRRNAKLILIRPAPWPQPVLSVITLGGWVMDPARK